MIFFLGVLLLCLYAAKRALVLVQAQRTCKTTNVPSLITLFPPMSVPGAFLPKSKLYRVLSFHWDERRTLYANAPLGTVKVTPLLYGAPQLYVSRPAGFRQILALGGPYGKTHTDILSMMGDNVVSTEGDAWKRHRRITAPAFSNTAYANVWDTAAQVYTDMLEREGWRDAAEVARTDFNEITHKVALFLIAIVGFGIPMSWCEPPRDKNGRLSVQAMVFTVATYTLERWAIPRWLYWFGTKKLSAIDEAYARFSEFMHERIAEREAELQTLRSAKGANDAEIAECIKDIFGRLVYARLAEGKLSLSTDEIIGNCFIFTFAGHETTATTLAAAFCLLAAHQDKQEWVYNSIKDVVGEREPTFDDFDALDCVLACFYEALRLYPASFLMVRQALEDTILTLPRTDDPDVLEHLPVKAGTVIALDSIGIGYDAAQYPNPTAFDPARWARTPAPGKAVFDDSAGFSFGPRVCLGHKFAKVEAVAFLTSVLREWRVEPALDAGESAAAWAARVLKPTFSMTMVFGKVPLRMVRRK